MKAGSYICGVPAPGIIHSLSQASTHLDQSKASCLSFIYIFNMNGLISKSSISYFKVFFHDYFTISVQKKHLYNTYLLNTWFNNKNIQQVVSDDDFSCLHEVQWNEVFMLTTRFLVTCVNGWELLMLLLCNHQKFTLKLSCLPYDPMVVIPFVYWYIHSVNHPK